MTLVMANVTPLKNCQRALGRGRIPAGDSVWITAMSELFEPGRYYRAREILRPAGPLPISTPTWWKLVKERRVPEPLRLGAHLVMWLGRDLNTAFSSPHRRQAEEGAVSAPSPQSPRKHLPASDMERSSRVRRLEEESS
jgi:predicted DNA-binding transcriptional regulator AlpA